MVSHALIVGMAMATLVFDIVIIIFVGVVLFVIIVKTTNIFLGDANCSLGRWGGSISDHVIIVVFVIIIIHLHFLVIVYVVAAAIDTVVVAAAAVGARCRCPSGGGRAQR